MNRYDDSECCASGRCEICSPGDNDWETYVPAKVYAQPQPWFDPSTNNNSHEGNLVGSTVTNRSSRSSIDPSVDQDIPKNNSHEGNK